MWLAVFATLIFVCLAFVLVFEALDKISGVWVFKPLASAFFLLLAWKAGAFQSSYGQAIFLGLVLSWFGDVFLMIPGQGPFRFGLFSFLLGHVAFVWAFAARGQKASVIFVALLGVLSIAWGVWLWLEQYLNDDFRIPVLAYIAVISAMVVLSSGTVGLRWNGWLWFGALFFFLSDLFVARERFVVSQFVNRSVGLPLYYIGQTFLALSILQG
jgi:uncharacterized membrane protein YhhN